MKTNQKCHRSSENHGPMFTLIRMQLLRKGLMVLEIMVTILQKIIFLGVNIKGCQVLLLEALLINKKGVNCYFLRRIKEIKI